MVKITPRCMDDMAPQRTEVQTAHDCYTPQKRDRDLTLLHTTQQLTNDSYSRKAKKNNARMQTLKEVGEQNATEQQETVRPGEQ